MIYTALRWVRTIAEHMCSSLFLGKNVFVSVQIQRRLFLEKQLLSQAYHGVLCSPSPSPHSLVVYCIDKLRCHNFSLHCVPVLPYQCMPCQLWSHVPAVHNLKVIWHLAPHWFYANSSREHENHARVTRSFLPRAGDAIHQHCGKGGVWVQN